MKKATKKLLALILMLVTLLTSVSCFDNMKEYSESGINFKLPKDMKQLDVEYADLCFGNTEGDKRAEFFIYIYAKQALLTQLFLPQDTTSEGYADWFVNVNEYENVERVSDTEKQLVIMEYVYEPEETYYRDYIIRNDYTLYHVTMTCKAEDADYFDPIFDEWCSYIYLDY